MLESIKAKMYSAERKMTEWVAISENPDKLAEKNKTLQEAKVLIAYFEGEFNALWDVMRIMNDEEELYECNCS
jgi:hypothetical protein